MKRSPLKRKKPPQRRKPTMVHDQASLLLATATGAPRPVLTPQGRILCEPYLAYIRAQPCCACEAPAPSDPHHHGPRGVGQKTHDPLTVPLCRMCHQFIEDKNHLPGLDVVSSEALIQKVQLEMVVRFCRSYFEQLEGKP